MEARHETIRTHHTGGRLDVVLARPAVRNAFDERMIADLTAALDAACAGEGVRCVVISGEGPVFCAGADLEWMKRAAAYSERENLEDARRLQALFATLYELPCTTIAVVRGAALGGGAGLAACCDVVLAEPAAKFGFTEVRLGIVPAVISPFVVRKIGRAAARRFFATGEIFDGRVAEHMGLVSELLPEAELDARAEAIVAQVLSVGPAAARRAKRLADEAADAAWPAIHEQTVSLIAAIRATDEAREGIAAFLEKRKPRWPEPTP